MAVPTLAPTPDECRSFFQSRGDGSLGLLPQRWLSRDDADRWSLFWYAARIVDDEIETRLSTGKEWRARIRGRGTDTRAGAAFDSFRNTLPPHIPDAWVLGGAGRALEAMDEERASKAPPTMENYLERARAKAGFPVALLNRLALPGEPHATVDAFSVELALSIQVGDDARDRARDASLGLWTITREEVGEAPKNPPPDWPSKVIDARLALARAFASKATATAMDLGPNARRVALEQVRFWVDALAGAVQDADRPVGWNLVAKTP